MNTKLNTWHHYMDIDNPCSGKVLASAPFASGENDGWDSYQTVNDPATNKKLSSVSFAATDEDAAMTWDSMDNHGAPVPQTSTTGAPATTLPDGANSSAENRPTGNATFDALWAQAVQFVSVWRGGTGFSCSCNAAGKKALKIETRRGCKLLVRPIGNNALSVHMDGADFIPGLMGKDGSIVFAMPIETDNFVEFARRLEMWTTSFLILFGRARAGLVARPAPMPTSGTQMDSGIMF